MIVVVAPIVGSRYQEGGIGRLDALKIGDPLILKREPANRYDDYAVLVLNTDREVIGHVSASFSRTVFIALRVKGKDVQATYCGSGCMSIQWPEAMP